MITIRDVAKRAGVSRSTVSLVLNNSPLVKEETRQLVLKVIEEMNYVPNNNARGLSSKNTNNLGIIIMTEQAITTAVSSGYEFNSHTGLTSHNISAGIMSRLADTGYGVAVEYFCSVQEPDDLPMLIKSKRVDGVFIVGSPYSPKLIENLKKRNIPFVMVGINSYEEGIDSIMADPGVGITISMDYLYKKGHRSPCLVNCPRAYRSYYTRKDAFEKAVHKMRLENSCWLLECKSNDGESGYKTFSKFWEEGNRPDCIIAANANIALGIMRYLYEQKIRIPDDISIIAYEDSMMCSYATPALTSVNVQKELMGQKAAECLLARIKDPEKKPEKIIIPPYFVRRDSVANRL